MKMTQMTPVHATNLVANTAYGVDVIVNFRGYFDLLDTSIIVFVIN